MEQGRGQGIFLSVVGIATLLVAIVGATFAYFSIQVTGNETASSIRVTTAQVGGVNFVDGTEILVTNAYPGYTKTKTFTVSATDLDNDQSIQYIVNLVTTTDSLSSAAAAKGDFVYALSAANSTSLGTIPAAVTNQNMPTEGTHQLAAGTLTGTSTHTYTLTVTLKESSTEQDELQGKSYAGVVQVVLATGEGLRTWDEQSSGWKTYTGNN